MHVKMVRALREAGSRINMGRATRWDCGPLSLSLRTLCGRTVLICRIKCAQMRHAHDSPHESRAWNLCPLERSGHCEQHLSNSQNSK